MPMPVQPLKAVAVIVITQKIAPEVLYGGGLAIGIAMLLLTVTGGNRVACPNRSETSRFAGFSSALELQLSLLALKDYVQADGMRGYVLAVFHSFVIIASSWATGDFRQRCPVFVLGSRFTRLCSSSTAHDFASAAGVQSSARSANDRRSTA